MHNVLLRLTSLGRREPAGCSSVRGEPFASFVTAHCTSCHDGDQKAGRLDLTATPQKPGRPGERSRPDSHSRLGGGRGDAA